MDEKFKQKLKLDLKKSGFGSELKTRKIFNEYNKDIPYCGWSIETGSIYLDKDENKSRELDLIASDESFLNNLNISDIKYQIFCEVKKSKSPWIVFKDIYISNEVNVKHGSYNKTITDTNDIFSKVETSLPKIMKWQGSGIHEAFKVPNQHSRWYSAFLSVVKASIDAYECDFEENFEESIDSISLNIYQPVVVLDGVLLSAELDVEDEINLEEIMFVSLPFEYTTKKYKKEKHSVDLVSLEHLNEYLKYSEARKWNIIDQMYNKIEEYTAKKIAKEDRGTFVLTYPKTDEKL